MLNIVIVEDNKTDMEIIVKSVSFLYKNAHTVEQSTLKECIDYFSSEGTQIPDLVLIDVNLKNDSGIEILEFLRKSDKYHSVPAAVFTLDYEGEDVDHAMRSGATFCLQKSTSKKLALQLKENEKYFILK